MMFASSSGGCILSPVTVYWVLFAFHRQLSWRHTDRFLERYTDSSLGCRLTAFLVTHTIFLEIYNLLGDTHNLLGDTCNFLGDTHNTQFWRHFLGQFVLLKADWTRKSNVKWNRQRFPLCFLFFFSVTISGPVYLLVITITLNQILNW